MPIMIEATGSTGLSAVVFQQVTVSTTALAFVVPPGIVPKRAWLTVETAAIRYRYDGDAPTTTVGHLLGTNGTYELIGSKAITAFRMIRNAAADATVAYTLEI